VKLFRAGRILHKLGQVTNLLIFTICVLGFSRSNPMLGQFLDQGAVTGTVQDNSGAVIPGAAVTIEETTPGFQLSTTRLLIFAA
jgi:hypothetical protein